MIRAVEVREPDVEGPRIGQSVDLQRLYEKLLPEFLRSSDGQNLAYALGKAELGADDDENVDTRELESIARVAFCEAAHKHDVNDDRFPCIAITQMRDAAVGQVRHLSAEARGGPGRGGRRRWTCGFCETTNRCDHGVRHAVYHSHCWKCGEPKPARGGWAGSRDNSESATDQIPLACTDRRTEMWEQKDADAIFERLTQDDIRRGEDDEDARRNAELFDRIRAELRKRLSPDEVALIDMKLASETNQTIADRLGIALGTVKSRWSRLVKRVDPIVRATLTPLEIRQVSDSHLRIFR